VPVKVVIVDDSITVRAVIRRILSKSPDIEVVGEAIDGRHGVDQTLALQPDVVIMDLDLPEMNGLDASVEITERCPTPIIVVTSSSDKESVARAFASMKQGVVGVFPKPGVPEGWNQLRRDLIQTICEIGPRRTKMATASDSRIAGEGGGLRFVAIGASTGGPGAVCEVIREFGHKFSVGVVVVQHITPGFESGFTDWLSLELGFKVSTAHHNEILRPGEVRIAPANHHLRLTQGGVFKLDNVTEPIKGHRPSVNILFESMAVFNPGSVAAVLLSGMGDDGVQGMIALRKAGVYTVTQSEETCAVFGMPRAALERGATEIALSPSEIGRSLVGSMSGENS
jgi:two-component system chemotaxis response regulator CheB